MAGSYYHAKDGMCFKRLEDGGVELRVYADAMCKGDPRVVVLDTDMWASVVASVSAAGDTRDQWKRVREVHNYQEDNLRG